MKLKWVFVLSFLVIGLLLCSLSGASSVNVNLSSTTQQGTCLMDDEGRGWTKSGKVLMVHYKCYCTPGCNPEYSYYCCPGCPVRPHGADYGTNRQAFLDALHNNVSLCMSSLIKYLDYFDADLISPENPETDPSLDIYPDRYPNFRIFVTKFYADIGGLWYFHIPNVDDNVDLIIDDQWLGFATYDGPALRMGVLTSSIYLTPGWHKALVRHYNGRTVFCMTLFYKKPGSANYYILGQYPNDVPIKTLQYKGQDITDCIPALKTTFFVDTGELF